MKHGFDEKALEISRRILMAQFSALNDTQLKAKIQVLVLEAMEFASASVRENPCPSVAKIET